MGEVCQVEVLIFFETRNFIMIYYKIKEQVKRYVILYAIEYPFK